MKVYIIHTAYDTHNCGGENTTEHKAYLSREKAEARLNELKEKIRAEFMESYHPDEDEFTEESTSTSYEIQRMDYYDWTSAEIIELDVEE